MSISPIFIWSWLETITATTHSSSSVRRVKKPLQCIQFLFTSQNSFQKDISFPIGSVLCQTHLKEQRKNKIFSEDETENITPSALLDPNFVSDKVVISNEQLEKSRDQGNNTTKTPECNPVQFK